MPKTILHARPVPQRTCVGCGTVRPKREMVRVIRTPEGSVVADPTGKMSGRGAYLCREASCWKAGLAKGRLERALKTPVSRADLDALSDFASSLGLVVATT